MSGWYSKAINVFRPEVPDQPQIFTVFCHCGEEYRGFRSDQHQQIVCKVCGEQLFILPRDVYPVPPPKSGKKSASHQSRPVPIEEETPSSESVSPHLDQILEDSVATFDVAPVDEEGDSPPGPEVDQQLPSLADLRDRIRNAGKPKPVRVAEAVPQKVDVTKAVRKSIILVLTETWEEFQRFWTPFRILVATVIMLLMATGGWMWRQAALSHAARIAQTEGAESLAALERDDWLAAYPHLQQAAAALKLLGRTDPEAQTIRQYARETEAMFRLCEASLLELVDAARKDLESRGSRNRKKGGLAPVYYGDWLIIEGVVSDSTPEKSRRRQLSMQIPLGNEQVLVECNFPQLEKLIPKGQRRAVILAGAISEISQSDEGEWKISLDPRSGFLWTHLKTYRFLGFEFNPFRTEQAVENELKEQARAVGVPE